jgi:hypothetical protein
VTMTDLSEEKIRAIQINNKKPAAFSGGGQG